MHLPPVGLKRAAQSAPQNAPLVPAGVSAVAAGSDPQPPAAVPADQNAELLARAKSAEEKLADARSEYEDAKAEADELQGKMHRSEDVAAMTTDLIYAIRGAMMALPGRLAVDVASANSPAEAAEIIRSVNARKKD